MSSPTDFREHTSISAVEPASEWGDIGQYGVVIGVAGFDLPDPETAPPGEGDIMVFTGGQWQYTKRNALEIPQAPVPLNDWGGDDGWGDLFSQGPPGPAGNAGTTGRDGAAGPPGTPTDLFIWEQEHEPSMTPGPPGPTGNLTYGDIGNGGASKTVNFTTADIQKLTLNSASCSITLAGATAAGQIIWLLLTQDSTGSRLVSWVTSLIWRGGIVPTLSTTPGVVDQISILYDGANYYATFIGGTSSGTTTTVQGGPTGPLPFSDWVDEMLDPIGPPPASAVAASSGGGSSLTVKDVSGSPSGVVTEIDFPQGTVSIAGSVATIRQAPVGFIGCRAYKNAAQTFATATPTAITFQVNEYDTDAIHSTSSNTSRFTVPTGLAGKWRCAAYIYFSAPNGTTLIRFKKNGTTLLKGTQIAFNGSVGFGLLAEADADLVATDYIEIEAYQSGGSPSVSDATNLEQACSFSMVKLDAGRVGTGVGAVVYNNAGQSIADNTVTALTFNTETFDTDGFHDTSTNTGRLTIPTGMGGVYMIVANIDVESSALTQIRIRKNGSTYLPGSVAQAGNAASGGRANYSLTVIDKPVAGDYYEAMAYQNSGGAVNAGTGSGPFQSSFSIMRLDQGAFGNLASANFVGTAGADYTKTTGAFADVNSTDFALTITTGARRVLIGFNGTAYNSGANGTHWRVLIDGVSTGLPDPALMHNYGTVIVGPAGFVIVSPVLSAGSHTFKLQWKVDGGTSTLRNSSEAVPQFWVQEMPDSGAAGGGAGAGGILTAIEYAPGSQQIYSSVGATGAIALATVDATNLAVTFVAPPSGRVVIDVSCWVDGSGSGQRGWLGLLEGSTQVGTAQMVVRDAEPGYLVSPRFYVSGLTPGSSHTYKLAFYNNGTSTLRIIVNAAASSSAPWGPVQMVVHAA